MKINFEEVASTALGVIIALIAFKLVDALVLDAAVNKLKEKTSK